ncbi:hypothetical protein SAY86_011498 [Trapa natans]|uniref:Uncharacterized protein n=1 Tax=Trapa natans TaxID=22666 RepID=A0AAN7LL69_TRANT|nr:hypothetical protein SAY86_011498 [Trapa natans]
MLGRLPSFLAESLPRPRGHKPILYAWRRSGDEIEGAHVEIRNNPLKMDESGSGSGSGDMKMCKKAKGGQMLGEPHSFRSNGWMDRIRNVSHLFLSQGKSRTPLLRAKLSVEVS